ncbi:Mar9 Transposase [Phytophthora megakarya]|uniref:Mar9 Transposase n=1 Tax=Phytophthora megakarya TaxID=4795 RepID=A0A225VQP2_9STRA|nr:Mar9 Transposase [Phytophthora megakarya]
MRWVLRVPYCETFWLKARSCAILALLTKANKHTRIRHALRHDIHGPTGSYFSPMYNECMWTRSGSTRTRTRGPSACCQAKMSLIVNAETNAAVARPRFDANEKILFDGKIGIWTFTEQTKSKRTSKNRLADAPETKKLDFVNGKVYKRYLLENVIPPIKVKWPMNEKCMPITIQQDNATPHCKPDDPDIAAAGRADGWNIQLDFQPPNSPDCNTLNLGYFTSIQALQYQADCYNLDQLIYAVKTSYAALAPVKLDNIFFTLQKVFECMLRAGGSNECTSCLILVRINCVAKESYLNRYHVIYRRFDTQSPSCTKASLSVYKNPEICCITKTV